MAVERARERACRRSRGGRGDPTLVVIGPEPQRRKPNITAPVLAPPAASEPLPLDLAIQAAVEAVLLEKIRKHERAAVVA